jgi:hypothetical protein
VSEEKDMQTQSRECAAFGILIKADDKFTAHVEKVVGEHHPMLHVLVSSISRSQPLAVAGLCSGKNGHDMRLYAEWDDSGVCSVDLVLLKEGKPLPDEMMNETLTANVERCLRYIQHALLTNQWDTESYLGSATRS